MKKIIQVVEQSVVGALMIVATVTLVAYAFVSIFKH